MIGYVGAEKKGKRKYIVGKKRGISCNVPVKFLKLGFNGKSAVFLKICSKKNKKVGEEI